MTVNLPTNGWEMFCLLIVAGVVVILGVLAIQWQGRRIGKKEKE